MSWLRRGLRRVRRSFGSAAFEQEMDQEMGYHLEQAVRELIAGGMSPAAARRAALRDFGNVTNHKERARAVRGVPMLDDLVRDLRFAWRNIRRAPGASMAAIGTLALGIGAATATLAVVRGVLLRPLPYPDPSRLTAVWEANLVRQRWSNSVSTVNFEAWVAGNKTFSGLAAMVPDKEVLRRERPERIRGALVSPSWFDIVAVRPAIGRGFTAEEAAAQAPVMVLSHALWRDRFGRDSSIVGRQVQFGDRSFTVVGVMPAGFTPPAFGWLTPDQSYWTPFWPNDGYRSWGRALLVLGRLRPGVTVAQGAADVALIAEQRAVVDPSNKDWSATAKDLKDEIVGEVRTPLFVLLAAVGGLLAATIVNVMFLTLARLRRRAPELSLRLALGAGRRRLTKQAATEGLAMGLLAAPIGVVLAFLAIAGLHAANPVNLARASSISIDLVAVAQAVLFTLATTMLASAVPVFVSSRATGLSHHVHGVTNRTTARGTGGRLVVAEIALAVVLTIGAGLVMRSFVNLLRTNLGFAADQVTAARVSLPSARYPNPQAVQFFDDMASRLERVPLIEAVGLVSVRPLGGTQVATTILPKDRSLDQSLAPVADVRLVTPGYFRALQIPFVSGEFPSGPSHGGEIPIVLTKALGQLLWPGRDPMGQKLRVNLYNDLDARVVGVVLDAHLNGPASEARPTLYLPFADFPSNEMDVLVRTRGEADAGLLVRETVASADPTIPAYEIESLASKFRDVTATDRVTFVLLGAFALVALTLAAAGVAGMLLVEVDRRRRELGVRRALGAASGALRVSIVRSGLTTAAIGIGLGIVGALGLTRYLATLLHGVAPTDPVTYLLVAAVLLAVAALATYLPARRATQVDPLEVLRSE